jgi:hypothetical protein
MRGKVYRRGLGWVSLVVMLGLFTACGSHGPSLSERRGDCYAGKTAAYAAVIVESYYDRGLLGTQLHVEQLLDPGERVSDTSHGFGAGFFDKRGKLIPYSQLTPRQQASFAVWESTLRVREITDVDRKVDLQNDRFLAECAHG